MAKKTVLIVFLLLLAGGAGFGISWWLNQPLSSLPEVQLPTHRPAFSLPNMQGESVSISRWDGKPLLINFWATWCPPCREEIPLLKDLQTRYGEQGLQVIGIAVDDMDKVRDYAATMDFNYPILVGQQEAVRVANQFGLDLYGLPVSVLVTADGRIVERHRGIISEAEAVALLAKILPPQQTKTGTQPPQ